VAKKSFWPYSIVLSIVAIILACAATIVVAINNPVEMDSAYMQSHQNVDENITFIKESEVRFDKKFDLLFGVRFEDLDIGVINTLANKAPKNLLPVLSASFDVDIDGLSENEARELIKNAFEIHYYSGTFYSLNKA